VDLEDQVDPDLLEKKEEQALYQALEETEAVDRDPGDVEAFLEVFLPLMPAVEAFFDQVLVMAEDQSVRSNRLALLGRIASLSEGAVDLSHLEGF